MGIERAFFVLFATSFVTGTMSSDASPSTPEERDVLREVKEQLITIQKVNNVLLSKVMQLEETTNRLENENTELKERIRAIENTAFTQVNNAPSRPTTDDSDRVDHSKAEVKGKSARSNIRRTSVGFKRSSLVRQNAAIIESETPLVAFYATLTSDIHGLGKGQNVVFDHVHTNIGNAYHSFHGIFTAPYKGLYMFSATVANIITGSYHVVDTQFVVNGNVVARTHGHAYDMSSQTLLLALDQGDDFSIQSDGQMMESFILGNHYSSFSGRLITTMH